MNKTVNGSTAQISVQLEQTDKFADLDAIKHVENMGRNLLVKLFPDEISKSDKVIGKIIFLKNNDKNSVFELNGLFLYRETYTAITHKIVFYMFKNEYKVVSIDEKEQ